MPDVSNDNITIAGQKAKRFTLGSGEGNVSTQAGGYVDLVTNIRQRLTFRASGATLSGDLAPAEGSMTLPAVATDRVTFVGPEVEVIEGLMLEPTATGRIEWRGGGIERSHSVIENALADLIARRFGRVEEPQSKE